MHCVRSGLDDLQRSRAGHLLWVRQIVTVSLGLSAAQSAPTMYLHLLSDVLHIHLFSTDDQQVQADCTDRSDSSGGHQRLHLDQDSAKGDSADAAPHRVVRLACNAGGTHFAAQTGSKAPSQQSQFGSRKSNRMARQSMPKDQHNGHHPQRYLTLPLSIHCRVQSDRCRILVRDVGEHWSSNARIWQVGAFQQSSASPLQTTQLSAPEQPAEPERSAGGDRSTSALDVAITESSEQFGYQCSWALQCIHSNGDQLKSQPNRNEQLQLLADQPDHEHQHYADLDGQRKPDLEHSVHTADQPQCAYDQHPSAVHAELWPVERPACHHHQHERRPTGQHQHRFVPWFV